jgi:hypothetical protein
MRDVSAQSGHCGQNSLTVHFGLGDAVKVDELRVQFLGGQDTTYTNIYANQLIEIVENALPSGTQTIENEGFAIHVFPNPANDSFSVVAEQLPPVPTVQLRFSDAMGRVVYEEKGRVVGGRFAANYSKKELGMVEGVYYLNLEVDGHVKTVLVK